MNVPCHPAQTPAQLAPSPRGPHKLPALAPGVSLLSAPACALNPLLFFFPRLGASPYFCSLRDRFSCGGRDVPPGLHPSQRGGPLDRAGGGEQVCSPGAAARGERVTDLTLHCSTFLFTSSSSSFKISSLLAAEDAPGPAPVPALLLELLAAWFSLWGGREEAHPRPQHQGRGVGWVCRRGMGTVTGDGKSRSCPAVVFPAPLASLTQRKRLLHQGVRPGRDGERSARLPKTPRVCRTLPMPPS